MHALWAKVEIRQILSHGCAENGMQRNCIFFNTVSWPLALIPAAHRSAPPARMELSTVPPSPAMSRISSRIEHSAVDVPGVGEVPSAWIGQAGRRKMGKLLEQEELRPVVKGLQRDLRILANTCFTALQKLNAERDEDPDVAKAVELCKQFSSGRVDSHCKATRIADLWRTQGETLPTGESSVQRAAEALGEKLVDVITEQNKEPPDVSVQ